MTDLRRLTGARTFRWNDGESTTGYHAVDVSEDGARWYRWSHVPGEGRIDVGHQSLEDLLERGPIGGPPPSIAAKIRDAARSLVAAPQT